MRGGVVGMSKQMYRPMLAVIHSHSDHTLEFEVDEDGDWLLWCDTCSDPLCGGSEDIMAGFQALLSSLGYGAKVQSGH